MKEKKLGKFRKELNVYFGWWVAQYILAELRNLEMSVLRPFYGTPPPSTAVEVLYAASAS
jgi:hypothetical protein